MTYRVACTRLKKNTEDVDNDNDDDDEDSIPLSLLRERLNLPATMTFEDYVSVDDDLQTDEKITEATILSELTANNDGEQEGGGRTMRLL